MDLKNIMTSVMGAVIISSIMYLFNSTGESKHNDDIQNIHIEYLMKSDDRKWNFYDKDVDTKIEDLKNKIETLEDQIIYWKEKAKENN